MDHTQDAHTEGQAAASAFVTDSGVRYRMPFRMVTKTTFADLKQDELIDARHAARLQYRLMLLESVIKATVDFANLKITVIYNPAGSGNGRPETDADKMRAFLEGQGVHALPENTREEHYDYITKLYSYAYLPARTRTSAPYGYTAQEWQSMEPAYEKKSANADKKKLAKFRAWQVQYLKEHPNASPHRAANATRSILHTFGIKKS